MSDLEKYINKTEEKYPGFKQELEDEFISLKIGEEIRLMRLASGMTQDELAKKMETTKSAISRLENHSSSMRLSTIEKVAKIFDKKVMLSFR